MRTWRSKPGCAKPRLLKRGNDGREHGRELARHRSDGRGKRYSNDSGDEPVFDRCDAAFVVRKTFDEVRHDVALGYFLMAIFDKWSGISVDRSQRVLSNPQSCVRMPCCASWRAGSLVDSLRF